MAQHLDLSLPATGDYLFLARLAAGAAAARIGLTVEELEDLHLAIDELCVLLLGPDEPKDLRLEIHLEWDDDELGVRCTLLPEPGHMGEVRRGSFDDEFSERILDALVDEHGLGDHDGLPMGFLRKRVRDRRAAG